MQTGHSFVTDGADHWLKTVAAEEPRIHKTVGGVTSCLNIVCDGAMRLHYTEA